MTNSPPSNVSLLPDEPGRVLATGIDSLVLAVEGYWLSDDTFKFLASVKEQAKKALKDSPVVVTFADGNGSWPFNVKPHGAGGYEWLLVSRDLTMKIGNWRTQEQRPNVMIEIRAETLWTHGPESLVKRVSMLLSLLGLKVVCIKPSRVDLTRDILLREGDWSLRLLENFVTRAVDTAVYFKHRKLSGFTIGSGDLLVRLYDKPLEIRKSKKLWMYDIWGIPEVPEGHRVIRVEAQMRRELLHSLGCDSWGDFEAKTDGVWAYDTRKWLRLVDNSTLHHTQQTLLPWWKLISAKFKGLQAGEPLVRTKAIQQDIYQLAAQTLGTLSSIATIVTSDSTIEGDELLDVRSHTDLALRIARDCTRLTDEAFTEGMKRKHAKYHRHPSSTSQKRKNRARVNRALNDEGENK